MPVARSLMGAGPKIALATSPVLAVAIAGTVLFREESRMPLPRMFEFQLGTLLFMLGAMLYGNAVFHLLRDFKRGILITEGAYAWTQNPLYASVIFFIMPAVALFSDSWPMLIVAATMYLAVKAFIGTEYAELESAFGQRYRDYRARTSELFPLPQRMGNRPVYH